MRIRLYADNPNYKDLLQVVETLRRGEVIICPTSTGYVYACDALQTKAVQEICTIKKLDPRKKSFSLIFKDLSQVSEYCKLSDKAFKLIKEHRGAYTFILPVSSTLPKVFKHRKEVGVRVVDNPISALILRELGNPMIVSSLPIEGIEREHMTDPELVEERYGWEVTTVADGGILNAGPSTIINCTQEPFELVRLGAGELYDEDLLLQSSR